MAGTINSLGLGSGVLTADIIDKLKKNDQALTITPIDNKITLANQKKDALSLLQSLLTSFKSSVSALDDDTLYQQRSVSGGNSAISVTADSGVAVQSFSISDTQLAKKNVIESGRFTAPTSTISSGSGTMSLSIGGKTYDIAYNSSMTLEGLKTAINNTAGEKVKASTLQVGENDYRLVLTSVETGSNQKISIADSAGGSLDYALYKQNDLRGSGVFSSPTSLVASGAVAQSDRFDLNQPLSNGDLSVTINGKAYYQPFTISSSDTISAFKQQLEADGFTLGVSPDQLSMTLTAKSPGVPYTIDSPFAVVGDVGATGSTVHLSDNVTPSGTYKITMNGTDYSIAYTKDTTLTQLRDSINTAIGTNVASIKQVGASYQLLIESTATGSDPTFAFSDTGGFLSTSLTTGMSDYGSAQEIQAATDASFKYNGIAITRPTNTITDIITGVTINLLQDNGSSNIAITQDSGAVASGISSMVQSYNTLMDQIGKMTLADTENGKVGIFNGDSSITNIRREITRMLTSIDANGHSLAGFGLDLSETGMLSFNQTAFTAAFEKDPTAAEKYFSGSVTYDPNGNESSRVDGIFTQFNTMMERYTGYNGIMSMLTTASKEEITSLTANKKRSESLLNARYDAMVSRFAEYDTIISRLNSQFSSLNQQIQMAISGK